MKFGLTLPYGPPSAPGAGDPEFTLRLGGPPIIIGGHSDAAAAGRAGRPDELVTELESFARNVMEQL